MTILIVMQTGLNFKPVFKQDQYNLEMYNSLKGKNDIKILYLHETSNFKKAAKEENDKDDINLEQYSFKDIIKQKQVKENINSFIKKNNIATIVFMSEYMMRLILPYIEKEIKNLNIICDFRMSNLAYVLEQYKEEKETKHQVNQTIIKQFRRNLLRSLSIIKSADYLILDKDIDTTLIKEENIKNIIDFTNIIFCIDKKSNTNLYQKTDYKILTCIINKNNLYTKNSNFLFKKNDYEYIINENINSNTVDNINRIINNIKTEYVCIYSDKINMIDKTIDLIVKNLSCNDNLSLASPLIQFFRYPNQFKFQFENQRNNNFSNWIETSPLSYSDFVVIKRKYFSKVGHFDNRFKTLDYAIFDFVLRLHQINSYYCTMNDIVVFKSANVSKNISLFKQDKLYLYKKWDENLILKLLKYSE